MGELAQPSAGSYCRYCLVLYGTYVVGKTEGHMGKWRLGKYKYVLSCNVLNIRQQQDTFDLLQHRRRHTALKKKPPLAGRQHDF